MVIKRDDDDAALAPNVPLSWERQVQFCGDCEQSRGMKEWGVGSKASAASVTKFNVYKRDGSVSAGMSCKP